MARQKGFFTYTGTLGTTVGVTLNGKSFVRSKPETQNMSETSLRSADEFGRGSKACSLTKMAFAPLMLRPFKPKLHNRLSEAYRKVIRSGPLDKKGERNVFDGDVSLLSGFEFSEKAKLKDIFMVTPYSGYDAGELTLELPAFTGKDIYRMPDKAEDVVLGLGFAFLDFNDYSYELGLAPELRVELKKGFSGGSLSMNVPDKKELLILVMMNLFFESATYNNKKSRIDNQKYQAGAFIRAIHLREGELVVFEKEELPIEEEQEKPVPNLVWKMK